MRDPLFPYKLYLVVSESACKLNILQVVEEAIFGGVDIVQIREKNLKVEDYVSKALQIKAVTDKHNVPLIINDNLEVAKQINAFGIHVGNNDLAPTLIRKNWKDCQNLGYSIEHLKQLRNEDAHSADCLGISPVFKTPTKRDTTTEWGLEGVKIIRQLTTKPLIAIGGLNVSNVSDVIRAGADCIAVVSAICAANNPGDVAYNLKKLILKSL